MKIPNAQSAFIDRRKLREYALNPAHRVGRHKAHLFRELLGLTEMEDAVLYTWLLETVLGHEAVPGERDNYGQRYEIDRLMVWGGRQAMVRSVWVIRPNENFPRLVTCYPLKRRVL